MKMLFVIIFGTVFFSSSSFSIEMNKAGPNSGHVARSATAQGIEAYNIELVDKGNIMQVYLLDLNLTNPTVENSSVTLEYINKKIIKIDCKAEKTYFLCGKPKETILNFKEVAVNSVRNRIKTKAVVYKLPLKFN